MTKLYRDAGPVRTLSLCDTERGCISARLAGIGVQYEHVTLPAVAFDSEAQHDEIIGNYIEPLDRLLSRMPRVALDVTSILPSHPRLAKIERELMTEHAHDVAEAQVLIEGGGVLFLRAGAGVFALECEAGDYVRVPPALSHWFEMDAQRGFRTIRLFENEAQPRVSQRGADMRGCYVLS